MLDLQKYAASELRRARIEQAVKDSLQDRPTCYDATSSGSFSGALRLVKAVHAGTIESGEMALQKRDRGDLPEPVVTAYAAQFRAPPGGKDVVTALAKALDPSRARLAFSRERGCAP